MVPRYSEPESEERLQRLDVISCYISPSVRLGMLSLPKNNVTLVYPIKDILKPDTVISTLSAPIFKKEGSNDKANLGKTPLSRELAARPEVVDLIGALASLPRSPHYVPLCPTCSLGSVKYGPQD